MAMQPFECLVLPHSNEQVKKSEIWLKKANILKQIYYELFFFCKKSMFFKYHGESITGHTLKIIIKDERA